SSPVTVTITSADAGSGLAAGSPSCTDNTSTALTLTPSATDTWTTSVAGEGTHTIDCQATDQASNQTLKQDTVKIDTTNPTITLSHSANGAGWNNSSPVSVSVAVSDTGSGIAAAPSCTVDGSPATVTGSASPYAVSVSGEGTHPVSCSVSDNAGNSNTGLDTVKLDLHAPSSLASSPTYNNDGTIDVSYTASDTGGSGLKRVDLYVKTPSGSSYTLAMSDVVGTGTGIDNTFAYSVPTVSGPTDYVQGTYRFYTRATDVADNVEAAPANPDATTTQTLQDSIAPSLSVSHSANGAGWNNSSPVTVTITSADTGSGIAAAPSCTVDGSPATVTGSASPYAVSVSGEGTHPVSCSVSDNAGNSNTGLDTVKLDLHAPSSLASSPTYNNDGTIDVSYTASDTGGSGLKRVDLYVKTPSGSSYTLAMSDVVGT